MAKLPFDVRPAPPKKKTQAHVRHYLKQWRKKRGLTQDQLSERVGCSRALIAQYETGITNIPEQMVYALEDALRTGPGGLFSVNPEKEGDVVDITDELRSLSEKERDKALGYIRGLKDQRSA